MDEYLRILLLCFRARKSALARPASRCALMASNKRTICCRPDDDGRRGYFEASMPKLRNRA